MKRKTSESLKQDLYYDLLYKYSELKMQYANIYEQYKAVKLQNTAYRNMISPPVNEMNLYNKGLKDALSTFKRLLFETPNFNLKEVEIAIKEKKF